MNNYAICSRNHYSNLWQSTSSLTSSSEKYRCELNTLNDSIKKKSKEKIERYSFKWVTWIFTQRLKKFISLCERMNYSKMLCTKMITKSCVIFDGANFIKIDESSLEISDNLFLSLLANWLIGCLWIPPPPPPG